MASLKVLHAQWSDSLMHFWAEDSNLFRAAREDGKDVAGAEAEPAHPWCSDPAVIAGALGSLGDIASRGESSTLRLRLPGRGARLSPSSALGGAMGSDETPSEEAPSLRTWTVRTLALPPADAARVLLELAESEPSEGADEWWHGAGFQYFREGARLARHVLAQQRFVPMLVQSVSGELRGAWYPWLSDQASAARTARLLQAMPGVARCCVDQLRGDAAAITEDFIAAVVDADCRGTLVREDFASALEGRDASTDPHVAWLGTLIGEERTIKGSPASRQELVKRVRGWVGLLEERGASSAWRLLFRLVEPQIVGLSPSETPDPNRADWMLHFHLQSLDKPSLVVDAEDLWLVTGDSVTVQGRRIDRPQELLLGELGRAMRIYRRIEAALDESEPTKLELNTKQAYEFLREVRPILLEQGFGVQSPDWWDTPAARLGARLRLDSPDGQLTELIPPGMSSAASPKLGVGALVKYRWEISLGDATLTLAEFEQLASRKVPLVRVNGRWVEIRPEDVQAAIKFIRENPGGEIKLAEALKLAFNTDLRQTGIGVVGVEATGWLHAFLNSESAGQVLKEIQPPKHFRGTLRPYQIRGVSWLVFQERLGFGVCLADDMGLGKTVQLLALLAWEREGMEAHEPDVVNPDPAAPRVAPTLLVVPMSVVGNWIHETARFCPHIKLLVHHGNTRLQNDEFIARAVASDLVITTYALAHRDRELLAKVQWGRVVLDEAQYVKNAVSKQSQAVRLLQAGHRVALTGTPVENRLTELWSIMDFLNPGYLGTAAGFRQKFAVSIERYHDRARADQLRGLVRPFVLRRLKSDPTVVADLPEKLESKEFSHLTGEQASLYESCVRRMLGEVETVEGIRRRGLVLAALVRLKQICNHPALLLKEGKNSPGPIDPSRSGKCIRLLEMLDEVVAEGDQALVFTQFREMGDILVPMLQHQLKKTVLFLHGGTTQTQRQALVEQFQKADGTSPILVLSLRAGGVGLNLTAATHVFHFDRWWNPAVENQATDRAYRIGQTRTVQVHKFVVRGTLEERIDQMIESKTELAENIIGAGENWLADLNTDQLREILTLRNDAVDDEV
ncbi:MAG: DEAD/DEAH box helicase [Phycisphaerales bacterium]